MLGWRTGRRLQETKDRREKRSAKENKPGAKTVGKKEGRTSSSGECLWVWLQRRFERLEEGEEVGVWRQGNKRVRTSVSEVLQSYERPMVRPTRDEGDVS